ncbi:MAG: DUF6457 domain-containing protein [Chloroflexota bacterium]
MDLRHCLDLIAEVAAEHGLASPGPMGAEEREVLLDLARVVAHAVERSAAPLACYTVGRAVAQADATERLALARAIVERIAPDPSGPSMAA